MNKTLFFICMTSVTMHAQAASEPSDVEIKAAIVRAIQLDAGSSIIFANRLWQRVNAPLKLCDITKYIETKSFTAEQKHIGDFNYRAQVKPVIVATKDYEEIKRIDKCDINSSNSDATVANFGVVNKGMQVKGSGIYEALEINLIKFQDGWK